MLLLGETAMGVSVVAGMGAGVGASVLPPHAAASMPNATTEPAAIGEECLLITITPYSSHDSPTGVDKESITSVSTLLVELDDRELLVQRNVVNQLVGELLHRFG